MRSPTRKKSKLIIARLREHSNPVNVQGMARFGINPKNTLGISIPFLRKMARELGRDHRLALELWKSGLHEARILASMIDEPDKVTGPQMDRWAADFDSWDVCDQTCSNLFDKSKFAYAKALEWPSRRQEFVKRAGFTLMAALAVHDKTMPDKKFIKFLPIIAREASDERNFVKKAVNWALRQVGKRNLHLNQAARSTSRKIMKQKSTAARWIASDALRELESTAVQQKLK